MILVAGGTGMIGRLVVRELARQGNPVAVLSHRPERAPAHFPGLKVEVRKGDARDAASLERAVQGVETIISAMQFPNYPIEDKRRGHTFEEVDARGNERLVAAAKQAGVRQYIYLSGAGAAKDGQYHWLRAKWRAEEAIRASGMTYTIIRPSWVYGPDDKSLNKFVAFARLLPFVPVIGSGDQQLQPVFVNDVAEAVVASVTAPSAANQTFEMGGPDRLTMNELIAIMLSVMGKKKPKLHSPAFLPRLAGAALQLVPFGTKPLSPDAVTFATMDAVADNTALTRALPDLRLTPVREGLATYLGKQARQAAPAVSR